MGHLTDFEKNVLRKDAALQGAVPAEVDFGSPRNPDCLNFGICRINYWNGKAMSLMPSCCPNRAIGFVRRWEQNGIELIFPKGNMAPATLEKHFGSGWFKVMDAYELPADLASKLGLSRFTFEPGRYPVLEMEGKLHLIFA